MAAGKKTKGKSKPKAKAARKKPAPRKKAARKAPARRAAPKSARRPKTRAKAKPIPTGPVVKPPPGVRIGIVTHYFTDLSVAVIRLESGVLRVGDNIHFRGHTTDFAQQVESLQVNRVPVAEVGPKDDFGMRVRDHARENDVVYKVK